ncbi:MAG: helix-turn-helix transcriptional regulator [Clostridiaceae bacterium]|nr:helix-turn-helix transcriptional regulator [Clostridiaceae bacterium]
MPADLFDSLVPEMKYFIFRNSSSYWKIVEATIDFVDITYVLGGKSVYYVNGVPYHVESGDLICIPRNSLRYAITDPENPMVAYASNFILFNLEGEKTTLPFPILSKIGEREDLLALYKELDFEWTRKKPGYGMKVRALFLAILHKYFSILYYKDSTETMDIRIKKAIRHIHDFYHTPMCVKDLADMVNLNPSYFGNLFKKHTGYSVNEYINYIRISNAENMLISQEFRISDVARRCGFEDNFYFSRVFKKIKGYPPSRINLI